MTYPSATDAPVGARQTDGGRNEDLRGRSAGVGVCAVMGLTWAASARGVLSSGVAAAVLIAGVAIAGGLMAGARRLRRVDAALPVSGPPRADSGHVRRSFNLVVLGELAAIAAAVTILVRSGHQQWIPAVICGLVGVHFVPLARLFRVRLYYGTAVALCMVAAATLILGATGAPAPLWHLLPGFGAALALWATGAGLLVADLLPGRQAS